MTKHSQRESHLSLRILLAEDNIVNQTLASRLLEKRDHDVIVVDNGKQALAVLDQQAFDVILMDVQMPEMDGFETTAAAIRESEKSTGRHIPIIAMTAHAMKGDKGTLVEASYGALSEHSSHGKNREPVEVAFDGEALLARLDGSTELCAELIDTFLQESPQTLSAVPGRSKLEAQRSFRPNPVLHCANLSTKAASRPAD